MDAGGVAMLIIGWVFLVIEIMMNYDIFSGNASFAVLNWQEYPSRCLATVVGESIGMNVLTIGTFFIGLQVWKKSKSFHGKILIFGSLAIFTLSFTLKLINSFP